MADNNHSAASKNEAALQQLEKFLKELKSKQHPTKLMTFSKLVTNTSKEVKKLPVMLTKKDLPE